MLSSAVALAAASFLALAPEVMLAPRAAASPSAAAPPSASPPITAPPPSTVPPASPPKTAAPPTAAPPSAAPPASPPKTAAPPTASPPSAAPPSTAPPPSSPPITTPPASPPTTPPTSAPPITTPPGDAPTGAPPITTPPGDAPPTAAPPTPSGDATPSPPPAEAGEPTEPFDQPPPDLATDPAGEAWPQAAPVPIPTQPAFVPPPVPPPPAPRSGRGMLIGAAVVGGTGLVVRVLTTISVVRAIHLSDGLPMDTMIRGAIFYDPLIATGIGLAGGGMARRGRLDAHRELFEGTPPHRARRKKLGWAMFGAGLGTWAITRMIGGTACRGNDDCKARVWEWGYYASLVGTVPGAMIGGYASGYDGYHRRFGHLADVGLAPVVNRQTQTWGLAVSGRF